MSSFAGKALVASPFLQDPNFLRSVIFIVRHSPEGAYGLVLNRPTPITIGDLLEHVLQRPFENDTPIFCGGPVEGPLVALHEREEFSDLKCELGCFLATEQKNLTEVCENPVGQYRVFDGYSGWGPLQLDEEIKRGGWLQWQPTKDDMFADYDGIWQYAVNRIGRDILSHGINPQRITDDPGMN